MRLEHICAVGRITRQVCLMWSEETAESVAKFLRYHYRALWAEYSRKLKKFEWGDKIIRHTF